MTEIDWRSVAGCSAISAVVAGLITAFCGEQMDQADRWLKKEWAMWRKAWSEMWDEKNAHARKHQTVMVPIEEYGVLLGAAEREMAALGLLGQAQERIRVLSATVIQLRGTVAETDADMDAYLDARNAR